MATKKRKGGHPAGKQRPSSKPKTPQLSAKASPLLDRIAGEIEGGSLAERRAIAAIKLSSCDARNRLAQGDLAAGKVCGCGAVADSNGDMKCLAEPSTEWCRELLRGDLVRGDAARI